MKQEKIYSSKLSLTINILTAVITPLIWWNYLDFTFPELTLEHARKFSQIGALINFLAALFLIIRLLWKSRYSRRMLQVEKLNQELEKHFELIKFETYSEEQKESYEREKRNKETTLANEMKNILDLDKIESNHMYLGIACLFVGTFMQVLGAGYVSP